MKYNDNGEYKDIYVKAFDTLPIGTEVDYDGETVPSGWTEIQDYSTSEIDTGKVWIDGKKIYRKVYNFTTPSSADTDSVIFTAPSNVYTMINLYGILTEGNARFTLNSYYSTSYYTTTYYNPSDGIRMKVGSSLVGRNGIVIVEYTKSN